MSIDVFLEIANDPDFMIPLSVERQPSASYVGGLFVPGTKTTLQVMATVQPATADAYANMPEGERVSGDQVLITTTQLRGSKDLAQADVVNSYLGSRWKVTSVEPWGHHGYYLCIMTRLGG